MKQKRHSKKNIIVKTNKTSRYRQEYMHLVSYFIHSYRYLLHMDYVIRPFMNDFSFCLLYVESVVWFQMLY